jgi:hypothetical protein
LSHNVFAAGAYQKLLLQFRLQHFEKLEELGVPPSTVTKPAPDLPLAVHTEKRLQKKQNSRRALPRGG